MLDNVIDINYYAVQSSRLNMRHRPVGLGIMGFGLPVQFQSAIRIAGGGRVCRYFDGTVLRLLGITELAGTLASTSF
jgi:hypothetical protein